MELLQSAKGWLVNYHTYLNSQYVNTTNSLSASRPFIEILLINKNDFLASLNLSLALHSCSYVHNFNCKVVIPQILSLLTL